MKRLFECKSLQTRVTRKLTARIHNKRVDKSKKWISQAAINLSKINYTFMLARQNNLRSKTTLPGLFKTRCSRTAINFDLLLHASHRLPTSDVYLLARFPLRLFVIPCPVIPTSNPEFLFLLWSIKPILPDTFFIIFNSLHIFLFQSFCNVVSLKRLYFEFKFHRIQIFHFYKFTK